MAAAKQKDRFRRRGIRALRNRQARSLPRSTVAPDGAIYAAAIGEKQHPPAQAPHHSYHYSPGHYHRHRRRRCDRRTAPGGKTPFIPFPQQLFFQHLIAFQPRGAPEELWNSRDDVVYSLAFEFRWPPSSPAPAIAARFWAIDGRGPFFRRKLAKAGFRAESPASHANSAGKLFLCTAKPRKKFFSVGPGSTNRKAPTSRALLTPSSFSQWGRLDWWSPPPAAAEKKKTAAKSSSRSDAPRLEFFCALRQYRGSGQRMVALVRPLRESRHKCRMPASPPSCSGKAVIHDGRSGDGVSWVSLAYLPRNVRANN